MRYYLVNMGEKWDIDEANDFLADAAGKEDKFNFMDFVKKIAGKDK